MHRDVHMGYKVPVQVVQWDGNTLSCAIYLLHRLYVRILFTGAWSSCYLKYHIPVQESHCTEVRKTQDQGTWTTCTGCLTRQTQD